MRDTELFTMLNLKQDLKNLPHYCGRFFKSFQAQASLYVEAWKQYEDGYTPSYVEITCPLIKGGQVSFYACDGDFSKSQVKTILSTIKKCLEYYK